MRNRTSRAGFTASVAVVLLGALAGGRVHAEPLTEVMDNAVWKGLQGCKSEEGTREYLKKYKNGRHADKARACLKRWGSSDIGNLLRVCEAHFAADRLTEGRGGTAVACYHQVLSRDPTNIRAVEGLRRVAEKYERWARTALDRGDFDKARRYLGKFRELSPEAPAVGEIEGEIARIEREREADANRKSETRKYTRLAREALNEGDLDRARRHLAKLRESNPKAPALDEIERRIAQIERDRETERKAQQAAEAKRKAAEAKRKLEEEERKRKERLAALLNKKIQDCDECPEMVVLPPGSFVMGSPPSEEGRRNNEDHAHEVKIPAPLAVSKFEVTFRQWDACVEAGGCNGYEPSDKDRGRGRNAVFNVNWHDAQSYVQWLSRKTGKRYRLLSEAEWEYAARARTRTSRYWGRDISEQCAYANGRDETSAEFIGWWTGAPCADGYTFVAPVGKYRANEFGLFDMLGNLWEWTQDCWHGSYAGAPADGSAWTAGGDCGARVLRGGSYGSKPDKIRAAVRSMGTLDQRKGTIGFRVGLTLFP